MARSKKHTNATTLYQLRSDVSDICKRENVYDPAKWLTTAMAGKDPRNIVSRLIEMIRKIPRDYLDGNRENSMPDEYEWEAIQKEAFEPVYDRAPVDYKFSHDAAKELMKYLHRNLIEVKSEAVTVKRDIAPITKDEIRNFLDVFEERY